MNLLTIFNLGNDIQYLRVSKIPTIHGEKRLLACMNDIIDVLEKENMGGEVLEEVKTWVQYLTSKYKEENNIIDSVDKDKLGKDATRWRAILREELERKPIVEVQLQTGLNPFELEKISNQEPSELLVEDVYNKLTEIEKSDYSDSAKCLLLGTATPAVMVALRGAEASIRNYYQCKTQNDPGKKTWRQLTKELKDNAGQLGIEETFIGFLDYIGDAKRNFAQHPNKTYTLREAVMIFMQVLALVEDVYSQI